MIKSQVYFVDHLTVLSWVVSIWPRVLWNRLRRGHRVGHCYVVDGSWYALLLAQVSALVAGIAVLRLTFRLRDVRDKAGTLVTLRISYWDTADFREQLVAEPAFQDLADSGLLHDRMHMYLTKAAAGGGPGTRGTIGHAMFMVRVCAWKMDQEQLDGNTAVLFLERLPWFESLRRYASSRGVSAVPVQAPIRLRVALRRRLPARIEYLLRLVKYRRLPAIQWNRFKRLHPSGLRNLGRNGSVPNRSVYSIDKAGSVPMVAVEGYGPPNLNRPELHSDLFFWQQSSLPASNVLVTFEDTRAPLDEQGWTEFRKHGMTAIALHLAATTVPSALVFSRSETKKWSPKLQFRSPGHRTEIIWVKEQMSNYWRLKSYWEDLSAQFNVKVFVTQNKYDARHCAIADALQATGGLTAVYQRAYESHPAAGTTIGADVVFGFSPLVANIEQLSGSEIRHHVTTGFPADHRIPFLREGAKSLRDTLQRNGAKQILAFFDENSMDDDRWHTGHGYMQENYQFLLKKVLDEPWFGLVIKPKIPRTLLRRLGPVAEMLKQAEATGRCFVYRDDFFRGNDTPAAAALAADVAVHSHLSGATAGLEAALAGVPSLLLDRDGWSASPFYRLERGQVVFTGWDELWDSCRRHWTSQSGIPGFGDWSPMLDELDPFRDGRAAERMGTYIQWLIEGFGGGLDRETVLADAAERYCALWGKDKVSQVNWEPAQDNTIHPTGESSDSHDILISSRSNVRSKDGR